MKLICMACDGDMVVDKHEGTMEELLDEITDMGSRWIFYPFHFVTTASGGTVKRAPEGLEYFVGKRLYIVRRFFADTLTKYDSYIDSSDDMYMALRTEILARS